jgi:uncharacterized protein (TIGR00661 family)
MRILYGAFAQGHGHFSKAAVLVPLLESRGHDVRVVSSGGQQAPAGYHFRWHRHFPALSYVVSEGKTDYQKSFAKWLREIPTVFSHLWKIRSLVREFSPEIVISDFEPLTASPLIEPGCEVIALSRQVALFDRAVPLPEEMAWERKLTRSVIRLFTAGADRMYGYHYQPASFRCVPPVIRQELRDLQPETGEHIFVYNYYHTVESGAPQALIAWAKSRRQPVKAYGFPQMPRGCEGPVCFQPADRNGMLEDMRTSKGVITSAGLTTPLEAFLLGKPVIAVPIPAQWEQLVNVFHLQQAGLARGSATWDYDALLDLAPPDTNHPLAGWLNTPVEKIVDHLFDGELAAAA